MTRRYQSGCEFPTDFCGGNPHQQLGRAWPRRVPGLPFRVDNCLGGKVGGRKPKRAGYGGGNLRRICGLDAHVFPSEQKFNL